MNTEDQSAVVAFLSSPAAHGGDAVERIDTHASIVFLTGDRAWKLKRAVRYDYLDYSTADRRRSMCEAEVRINRRTAAALYRRVAAVTRQADGHLAIDGNGTPIDWLVEMARFDSDGLLDRLAEAGTLALQVMNPLAHEIAKFHRAADCHGYQGGWDAMRRIIDGNADGFSHEGAGILDAERCAALTQRARAALHRAGVLLDQRREEGWVRHCHGDLHLRNIVLLDGQPTMFDAIEFNDDISSIDVLYDLAFLLMDLWHLGLTHHANVVWNGYLSDTGGLDGLPLMPLYLSCRAAVRAKTTATSANLHTDADQRMELQQLANEYLAMADALLQPPAPRVIAVGGLSGSGKSTLARALAPSAGAAPGAIVVRSDDIRKAVCGVKPLDRLGPEAYTDDVSRRVYATLLEHVNAVVRGGYTAIADAVFAEASDRDGVQHVAAAAGVPFTGLWLNVRESTLVSRVDARQGDVSDAGPDVVRRQFARHMDPLEWHRIDASGTRQQVHDHAGDVLATVSE